MTDANTPVLRVIELGAQPVRLPPGRRRRFELSAQQAWYYNDHPLAILADFDQRGQVAVLREIRRHWRAWRAQQTPEQAEWVRRQRLRGYRSTLAAAAAILAALER